MAEAASGSGLAHLTEVDVTVPVAVSFLHYWMSIPLHKSHHFNAGTLCFSNGSASEAPGTLTSARVSLTMHSCVNRCSSFSPHSFAVLCLTWLEQTALYSLILELQIGMQTVRGVPNTRKRCAVKCSVYSHTVQWRIRHRGQSEAPQT